MTFSDLDDAFQELERRADAAGSSLPARTVDHPRRDHADRPHRRTRNLVAVAASVVAVAAVAAVAAGMGNASSHHPAVEAGHQPTRPTSAPAHSTSSSPSQTARSTGRATDVPQSQAALIARFRSILAGTATFTVDTANSTDTLITGVLTSSSGTRGMYVLELDHDVAICGSMGVPGQAPTALPCPHVSTLPDGSRLKVDPTYPDGPPDGVMNDAILSRPDGWQISLYTANVQAKYYGAPVLGTRPALTTAAVTDVVTSPQWVAN